MTEQEIEKLKAMLASCNSTDINLAGIIIKEQLLKLSDEQLETLFKLFDYAIENKGKDIHSFNLKDLLSGEVKTMNEIQDSESLIYKWMLKGTPDKLTQLFSASDRYSSQPLIKMTKTKRNI